MLSPAWSQNLIRNVRKIKKEDRVRIQTANRRWILHSQLVVAARHQHNKRAQVRTPSPPQAPPMHNFGSLITMLGPTRLLQFGVEEETITTTVDGGVLGDAKSHNRLQDREGFVSPRNASMATV